MKLSAWGLILMAAVATVTGACGEDGIPDITGVREWRFTDGSAERARVRVWEGKVWIAGDGRKPWDKVIDRTIPEQKAIVEGLETGKLHIAHPEVRFSVKTVSGPLTSSEYRESDWLVGAERKWTRTDGNTAVGCLLNLADDEISVRIGDTAWRISVSELGGEDREYLKRVLRREEPVFPLGVECPYVSYGASDQFRAPPRISGERFMHDGGTKISFEDALRLAEERLAASVDRKSWKLHAMTENTFGRRSDGSAGPVEPKRLRRGYQVCFQIDKARIRAAREKLDERVSDEGWHWVYVLDDGTFVEIPTKKK